MDKISIIMSDMIMTDQHQETKSAIGQTYQLLFCLIGSENNKKAQHGNSWDVHVACVYVLGGEGR